jgi:phenylalanine-4-hydroxylase
MFTKVDHKTWSTLFQRQVHLLQERAVPEFLDGVEKLSMCSDMIPSFADLSHILGKTTGFSIVPAKGLVPEAEFFKLLSERKFPSTAFIRSPHQLDYLEEPDIFHDVFGHVPLLINPIFADFMEEFGKKGLKAIATGKGQWAGAFYWFTVEFGLISTDKGIRAYGAGLASSPGELVYSLQSDIPERRAFCWEDILNTKYRTDTFQKTYFVINHFQELFDALREFDF